MITFRGVRPYYGEDAFLKSCRIDSLPSIENETAIIPHRPGVLNVSKIHRERSINLEFDIRGRTPSKNGQIVESIIRWAETDTDERFIADEFPDRFFLARLTSADDPDYAEEFPTLKLAFTCANPYGYSLNEYSEAVGETIAYYGTVAYWPTITFTPTVDTPGPHWSDGTRFLTFESDYVAKAGHEIVIDCANRVCTDNGDSIMEYLNLNSDWLKLERFENKIQGTGGRVLWRCAFL